MRSRVSAAPQSALPAFRRDESKNIRAVRALGENHANQGSVPQLPRRESNKQRKMILCWIKELAFANRIS